MRVLALLKLFRVACAWDLTTNPMFFILVASDIYTYSIFLEASLVQIVECISILLTLIFNKEIINICLYICIHFTMYRHTLQNKTKVYEILLFGIPKISK